MLKAVLSLYWKPAKELSRLGIECERPNEKWR
jgi:hypothetical protein